MDFSFIKASIIKNKIHIISFFFLLNFSMFGQDDMHNVVIDSIQILDVLNESSKLKFSSSGDGNSVLQTLENQSFAAVRTGGPAVLATLLHRGMASRHIGVIWGGFNIQSVVNGTFDLGLIRNTFDNVKFYQNGTSAATGNASIAGALALGNNAFGLKSTSINFDFSSAKNKRITVINKLTSKKYAHHFAINTTQNKNQYSYLNNGTKVTQNSAKFSLWDLNYEGHFLLSEKINVKGGGWLQKANRNIPPTKTSVDLKQEQEDINYRSFLQLAYYLSNSSKLNLRTAYFDETIEYQAPGILSSANADIVNFALDYTTKQGVHLGTFFRKDIVNASFFQSTQYRNTFSLLADFETNIKSFEIGASIRPEWVDKMLQPMIVGLRVKKEISNSLSSTFRYNKGYNLPSFNDLYWPAGGNENLKSEKSHEMELGIKYQFEKSADSKIKVDFFFNLIDDWIQWTPVNGIFEPINQRKVRNSGLELELSHTHSFSSNTKLGYQILYTFTDSRVLENYLNSDNDGKRSIFVPAHKLSGQISFTKNSWQAFLKPLYYSKRYDSVDNSSFAAGFFILDLEVMKMFKIKDVEVLAALKIENGLNNDYENIKFYPMPLRVFSIGVDFKI